MKTATISFKRRLKGIYLVLSAICISLLNLPLAFSRPVVKNRMSLHPDSFSTSTAVSNSSKLSTVYDSLRLNLLGLSRDAFEQARKGWERLNAKGLLHDPSIITIVDFSQPSTNKRMFVLDLDQYRVVFNTWVAHGRNSGKEWAQSFSNTLSSFKSSLGFYLTGDTYFGGNGYSLKLNGLEKGINDKAIRRAIVLHGADYVSQSFINANGFLGRSFGCPAVPSNEAQPIINTIKGGSCLFIYSPDRYYLSHSAILNS